MPPGVTPQEAKEIHLNGSPVGIRFKVGGANTTTYGGSYSDAVNVFTGAEKPPSDLKKGSSNPDGAMVVQTDKEGLVIESKYIEDWSRSIYNPRIDFPFQHFAVESIVIQLKKYSIKYDRVDWYTNSLEFARTYAKKFKDAGTENFTFTIIPTIRVKP